MTTSTQVDELRKTIREHDHLYYNANRPEITDAQYDNLMGKLKDLEYNNPELSDPDSPTQRVGGTVASGFPRVNHNPPMLSLANAKTSDDFEAWHARCSRTLAPETFSMTAELKFDGLALSLIYQEQHLVARRHPRKRKRRRRRNPYRTHYTKRPVGAARLRPRRNLSPRRSLHANRRFHKTQQATPRNG